MRARATETASEPFPVSLERLLSVYFKRRVQIASIQKGSCPYWSDFYTRKLAVELASGRCLNIFFKDYGFSASPRKEGLRVGRREIDTYCLLSRAQVPGLPKVYGWVWDTERQRYWLFLEDVGNTRLEHGCFKDWVRAVRWLGRFHGQFLNQESALKQAVPGLPVYNRSYYMNTAAAADRALRQTVGIDDKWAKIRQRDQKRLQAIVEFFPKVARHLAAQEPTLIHGDCYSQNVLLRWRSPNACIPDVHFVDWETVTVGPGAFDLWALLLWWESPKRDRLIDDYLYALGRKTGQRSDRGLFYQTLECCWVFNTLANIADLDWGEGQYYRSRYRMSLAYRLHRIEQFMRTGFDE